MMPNSYQRITALLQTCGTEQGVMPPTALYEEGWMLRLVLDWFSRNPYPGHALSFADGSRWYCEALLCTQFSSSARGDRLGESWTHADGVIGHFEIGKNRKGDLTLQDSVTQFVVVEAKMHSGLSAGTKNALGYNQAARTVACMAQTLCEAGLKPTDETKLGFVVCAPQEQIERGIFKQQIDKEHLAQTVRNRVESYGNEKSQWLKEHFEPVLRAVRIELVSWESLIEEITRHDQDAGHSLVEFYQKCLQYNRRKPVEAGVL